MSVILLDREIVHYEVLGRGRPLVFLHGWVGSWRYWIPAMQAASVAFRAYAIDLWGFGDSAKNRRYSVSEEAALVDSFLEGMGIGRLALIGHGLGAWVALEVARRNPASVDRVMAVACPLEEKDISARLRTQPPRELAEWLLGRNSLTDPVLTDAPKADPQALTVSLNPVDQENAAGAWAQLPVACLLVNGANDPAVLPPGPERCADLPPQAHTVLFEQSGHFPMIDESSKFNRLLMDFLALPSGETPRVLQLKEEWKRRVR